MSSIYSTSIDNANNILAIDTCAGKCSVALAEAAPYRLIGQSQSQQEQTQASMLIPMIQALLTKHHITFADIKKIYVTTGPGSFTGLRIGLATAKALAFSANIPVVGVSTLTTIAFCLTKKTATNCLAVMGAGKGEVSVQRYNAACEPLSSPQLIKTDALAAYRSAHVIGGYMTDRQYAQLSPELHTVFIPSPPQAATIGEMVAQLIARGNTQHFLAPEPLYVRPPDAKLP